MNFVFAAANDVALISLPSGLKRVTLFSAFRYPGSSEPSGIDKSGDRPI
jgi:hypothetical protein